MKNEQEIVRSVFDAYIRDAKAISTKKDRPTFDMLEEVKNRAIKALEQQKPMEKFENAKDHIRKLAGDYKCWDNRLSYEESLELCNILEQPTSDDCVSRAEVNKLYDEYRPRLATHVSEFGDKLKALPPVTPTFPKGATNGDMIKAMFPSIEVKEKNNGYEVYFGIGTASQYFNHQWWNAPYKRGNENG